MGRLSPKPRSVHGRPGAFTVHRPDHWVFAKTGLSRNDAFGGTHTIVGYECDGCEITWKEGLPLPTGRDGTPESFTILGTCEARWAPGDSYWYDRFPKDRVGAAVMGTYTRGGPVFTAGPPIGPTDSQGGMKKSSRLPTTFSIDFPNNPLKRTHLIPFLK